MSTSPMQFWELNVCISGRMHSFNFTAVCYHVLVLISAATAFDAKCRSVPINPFIHHCGPLRGGRLDQSHATCQGSASSITGRFIKTSKLI